VSCSPSVVPAAKLMPMAAGHVCPALVQLLALTCMLDMSRNACLGSRGERGGWGWTIGGQEGVGRGSGGRRGQARVARGRRDHMMKT
jgi:hypothetical protein